MITAENLSSFRRREHVLYGSEDQTPCTCHVAPGGSINVALIDVDPNSHEAVAPIKDNRTTFILHPAIVAAEAAGMVYRGTVNGRTNDFTKVETIVDHGRVKVERWRMRDPGAAGVSDGTLMLFVTTFHNQATRRIELLFFYENLTAQTGTVPDIGFAVANVTNLRELKFYYATNAANLFAGYSRPAMEDAAAGYWEGCLPFETATMAANRTTDPEAITQSAQLVHPLYAGVPHATFGLWKQTPLAFDSTKRDADLNIARTFDGANPFDAYAHLGHITDPDPSNTGGQPEYGAWTHTYSQLGGGLSSGIDSRSLWALHTAAMRHANRPVWYTEDTGEPLIPANHTYAGGSRVWDEQLWWGLNPATERFRRAAGRGNAVGPFQGHDVEHIGWNLLAQDFLLTGSFAARHLLIMIQGNMHAHNEGFTGFSESRAVGRYAMSAAMCYRSTGVTAALEHFADMWPTIYADWLSRCAPTDPFRPYVAGNQGVNGYAPGTWIWQCWQGGILVAGLDAALRMNDLAGVFTPTVRAQMAELQLAEARALVNLSFAPACACGADGERWAVNINFGRGTRAVCPVLAPDDYCGTPGDPQFRKLSPDIGAQFSVSWLIMGVRIARRLDPALAARCDVIEGVHRPGIMAFNPGGNTRDDIGPQYLGAG